MKKKIQKKEVLRFLVGGGSAVVVDFCVYRLLMLCIDVSAAKVISYIAGAAVGFIINKLWTFESKRFSFGEIGRYCILYMCSAAANAFVNKCVLLVTGIYILAFLMATGVSTIINFLGQKFLVFRK